MSTLTIRKTWQVNGVLTNPDSIVLRDPTGTYGIQRNDTGAVIVAAGTAMTPLATGVYEYTLAVDGGTTYTAWVEVVYGGETYRFEITAVPDVQVAAANYPESLVAARNQCAALLAQITLNQKPSYRAYGRTYSWSEYQAMLAKQIDDLNRLIAEANPFEIVSRG
jgi:hypothetical protein